MRLDLHIHSVASDGTWTPEEVVAGAVDGRLDVIALADHDSVAGVASAVEAASAHSLHVVPASELSSTRSGRELHILGLFIDPAASAIVEHQERARWLRIARMEEMLSRLRGNGIRVGMEEVLEAAGPRMHIVGRPHLARVLVEEGHAATVADAFDRLIGDKHAAFVPTDLLDPLEAVDVVIRSGGIPVWAHPPGDLVDPLLPELVKEGLRGLEVYRPANRPAQVDRLREIARTAGLLCSGGSDWHDPARNDPLGTFWVGREELAPLLEAGGI